MLVPSCVYVCQHPYFDAPKRERDCFTVKHYAGDVTYLCTGFREKNKDALHPDLSGVMQQSSLALVAALFPAAEIAAAAAGPAPGGGGKKKGKSTDRMTVASQFMTQLASLMRTINDTGVHYVRCIKPNTLNQPKIFQLSHSALQLRCAGVLEAVRISRMAYPNRLPHAGFVRRYSLLATPAWNSAHPSAVLAARKATPGDAEVLAFCKSLLVDVVDDAARYQLGKTKVFFRAFLLEALEQRRSASLSVSAIVVQKHLRSLMCQQRFRRMLLAAIMVQKVQRFLAARRTYHKQRASSIRLQAGWRGASTRKRTKQLRAAVRLEAAARARAARAKVVEIRRHARSTTIQKHARRRSKQQAFRKMHDAALRLQSFVRMVHQRRAYRRELNEKKEEAKLSTQLAKLQARLQAEMEARQQAESEQEKLKADIASGKVAPPAAAAPGAAAPVAGASGASASACAEASSAAQSDPAALGSRLGLAAGKFFSGFVNSASSASSLDETAQMLQAVTKDREKLSKRLEAETEKRKALEAERRELESKLAAAGVVGGVNTRKTKDVHASLARKTEELRELKQMFQAQASEISQLQGAITAKDKRMIEMEKKLSQFDDTFYSLEARNVRDRTKMEEMGKAKNKAEEERSIYRLMLEQCHEVRARLTPTPANMPTALSRRDQRRAPCAHPRAPPAEMRVPCLCHGLSACAQGEARIAQGRAGEARRERQPQPGEEGAHRRAREGAARQGPDG